MAEVPETLEGWYALHDFRTMDWSKWRSVPIDERVKITSELSEYLSVAESVTAGSSAVFNTIGHKADFLSLHLRPTLIELGNLELKLSNLRIGDFLKPSTSYLSVTELSLYEAYARGGTEEPSKLVELPFVQQRLYFKIPDMEYVSFYPMNKRRGETVNWYSAEMEERRRMMREHGATGRKYHGKVQQMITGSTGLDDWEWGVTLFANDPLDIKKLVYEMRFDEVTAKYADFGKFLIGNRIKQEEIAAYFSP